MIAFFKKHPVLSNLLAMFLVAVVLLVAVFYWLDVYTHHGETELVPDVRDLSVENATDLLQKNGMQCAVVDSVFIPDAKPGVVLEQSPVAGAFVKEGRRIYLIVNALSAQMIAFPDVVDMSLRQAKVQIESADFVIKEVKYEPSAYRDLVLYVDYQGDTIQNAQKLPYKSEVVLHVGLGEGIEMVKDSTDTILSVEEMIEQVLLEQDFTY